MALERTNELFHGADPEVVRTTLGYMIDTQRESWGDRAVTMLLVGYSADQFFDDIKPLYEEHDLAVREVYAPQSDSLGDERRMEIPDGSITDPDGVVCLFDNTMRKGCSMAAAIRDLMSAYADGRVQFGLLSTMVLKDHLGGSAYPLALRMPRVTTPSRFLRRKEILPQLRRASAEARKHGQELLFETGPRDHPYLLFNDQGFYLPEEVGKLVDEIVESACLESRGVEV